MTTSLSSAETSVVVAETVAPPAPRIPAERGYRIRHTLPSRFAFLMICVAIVVSALAYGTVHYWALGLFNIGGLVILLLWVMDGWTLGTFRINRNALQLPLIGAIVLGLVQLLPLREISSGGVGGIGLANTLSLDSNSTK